MFQQVPPTTWPACQPLLQRAIDRSAGQMTAALIEDGLRAGRFQLWADLDRETPVAAVTAINEYAQTTVLSVLLIGGTALPAWLAEVEDALAAFASDQGCTALEAYVRPGLIGAAYRPQRAALQRWRPHWTLVRMKL